MIIDDIVYGKQKIEEPVLLELIASKPVQRLKGIKQGGISCKVCPNHEFTRYDHCVGVMLLLKSLGAPVEEQIAGLLHDVPHTAFSHVADHLFNSHEDSYHEQHHERIITQSEIPSILEKHGFAVERLLDERNFPLLERDSPDLCADRADYTMRHQACVLKQVKEARSHFAHLIVRDGQMVFDSAAAAKAFTEDYLAMEIGSWSDMREVAAYEILANAMRRAIALGKLSEDDLFQDDAFVWDLLAGIDDQQVQEQLSLLTPALQVVDDPERFDIFTITKARVIDPKYVTAEGVLRRASEAYPSLALENKAHKELIAKGFHIRIVKN